MSSMVDIIRKLRTILIVIAVIGLNPSHANAVSESPAVDPYWQQEVNYVMDVELHDDLRTISGSIEIEYINNSPDTLRVLYLKAFPNAIQEGSYADDKRRTMNDYSFAALTPDREGSLELFHGEAAPYYSTFETDNTIIAVNLTLPLLPSARLTLRFDFKTVLPKPDNLRMGVKKGTTKAVYWYPQVCVYDRKMGWVNSQYVGWGECYGDFGRFDVTITAPQDQIVAASGLLVNSDEAMPDSLLEKLLIGNYLKPKSEWPKLYLDSGKTKKWHYVAENVNDFAFTASSDFCIDTGSVNGVRVVSYPLRKNAKGWIEAVRLGKEAIQTHSELFYPYQWPVIRICDAFSGMEYPMLTNCSGGGPKPQFRMLLYHEIGHQWFMGQVGSNQVDRPFLDEGFTTHMEHIAMEKYYGREGNYNNFTKWYQKKFAPPVEDRNVRGFRPLMLLMKEGFDKPMSFSYDQGEEYWPYRVSAYYKSAAMHYSLRSILGDPLYYRAMHHYCDLWFFRHPYEQDFTNAMEDVSGLQLDQFLNQWYYSRHRLDYAFAGRSKEQSGRYTEHTVRLKNKGKFIAPIDIAVIWQQGDTTFYTVAPEGMQYAKHNFILLPEWPQFRRQNNDYRFTIKAERDIKKIVIDPFNLLIDINRLNNSSGFLPPIEMRLDNMKYDRTAVNKYSLRWRPDFWYDEPNGVQLGIHAHGAYLETDHRFSLDLRMGTESGRPAIDFAFSHPFKAFGQKSWIGHRILRTDRRTYLATSLDKLFKKRQSRPDGEYFRVTLDYFDMDGRRSSRFDPIDADIQRFLPESNWDGSRVATAEFYFRFDRTFRYGSYFLETTDLLGRYGLNEQLEAFEWSQFVFGLTLTRSKKRYLQLRLEQFGTGGVPPSEQLQHLSRVSPMETFKRSKLFRTPGTFPTDWADDFYATVNRVRGYQDRAIYLSESYGGSLELTPPDLLPYRWLRKTPVVGPFLSKIDQSFFVDIAAVSLQGKETFYAPPIRFSETSAKGDGRTTYVSAGLSISMPPVWSRHHVRLDFPIYLNKPAIGDDEFEFRFSVVWLMPGVR